MSLTECINMFLIFVLYAILLIPLSRLDNQISFSNRPASDNSNWVQKSLSPASCINKVHPSSILFYYLELNKRNNLKIDLIYTFSLLVVTLIIKLEAKIEKSFESNIYVH